MTNDVNSTIRRILDEGLPQEPYTPDIFTAKVQLVFDHVLTAYGDNGESAYEPRVDIHFTPNLEVDVMAKYAEKLLAGFIPAREQETK